MTGYRPLLIDAKTSKEGTENMIKQGKAIAVITDDAYQYECLKISLDDILYGEKTYAFTPVWENEVIFCSSGTTGDVKMMIYNGENFVNQICCALDMPEESLDISLAVISMLFATNPLDLRMATAFIALSLPLVFAVK